MSLFPTQEVGSLMRAPFLRKRLDEKAVSEAWYWGRMLGVVEFEEFVQRLRRGECSSEELRDWASLYGIRLHETAGLDVVYDGEQRRIEMYEHALRQVRGVEFLGKVKVWDAETYNKAAIKSKPSLAENSYVPEFLFVKRHARKQIKIPLTGPYTLAEWSFDEYYIARADASRGLVNRKREAKREMVFDFAREVVRPAVLSLVERGADRIQIDEPAATTKPEEVGLFVEAFNELVKGVNARFTIHICYSDYNLLFPHILEAKTHELSIECANRDTVKPGQGPGERRGYEILKLFKEHSQGFAVAPGVIDVHTDFIEPPELVKDRLLYSAKLLDDPSLVIACNDCGLRTRRWEVAFKKEKSLVEGASLARNTFEKR
ncbi:MAG: hypothetical protein RMJ28_03240 [Nitrososphaerota archaeon]|nr:hypothetical protein [Candidatus Calditenuaceae archaeon]MDW8073235.1 hypothetical protein [Nitrososphaerota archaeon]